MIHIAVYSTVAKPFQTPPFYVVSKQVVYKCVPKLRIGDIVETQRIDVSIYTTPVAKFIKREFEKSSCENANIEERFVKLVEARDEKKIKEEDQILTKKGDSDRSLSSSTDISGDTKTNRRACSTLTSSDDSYIHRYESLRQGDRGRCNRSRNHHRSPTHPMHKRNYSRSKPNVLVPVQKRYQTVVSSSS